MNPNIPGSPNPPAGAPAQPVGDASGLDGDAAALKISIQTGNKAASRKADDEVIDTYAGIKRLKSLDAVAQLKVAVDEARFAQEIKKLLSGNSPNLKAAATALRAQFAQWCQTAGVYGDAGTFAVFAGDMRSTLADNGVSGEHVDAAFGEAESTLKDFQPSSVGTHQRGNV